MTSAATDGYRQLSFTDFSGGLNLRDKADVISDTEAIDLLNVTFTEHGAIRQRDGYSDFQAADLTNRVDSLSPFYNVAGVKQLIAGCGTRLEAINTAGVVVASQAGLTGGPWRFARFGDPTHEYLYACNGGDTAQRWDGAAWVSGAALATVNGAAGQAMPRAGVMCATASTPGSTSGTNASNRLVATAYGSQTTAGPGGTQSTPSRVHFSNAGQPEVWETDGNASPIRGRNFIDLTPGDGERIITAIAWRELVFIFKETKFFVLWGEGTGADGTPTFQVREVVNAIGITSPLAVCSGRDGVYFFNRRGVYRTSGGDPVLLSDKLTPLWMGGLEVYYRGEQINLAQLALVRMHWHMEQIFLAVPTGTRIYCDRVLVYDTQHNWWTVFDMPASAFATFRRQSSPELHFGYATDSQRSGYQVPDSVLDRGSTIVSRWRSGWGDYGNSQVKTVRESRLWGRGAAIVEFSTDFYRRNRTSADVHFGPIGSEWTYAQLTARGGTYAQLKLDYTTYEALAENTPNLASIEQVTVRNAVRGVVFSTEISNSPQEPMWAVHRVARHLREVRKPSLIV